jgi:hypothetical protein
MRMPNEVIEFRWEEDTVTVIKIFVRKDEARVSPT